MRTLPLLVTVSLVTLALAGCVDNDAESTSEGRARGFSVGVPEEVERVRVEVRATTRDDVNVRVEVEREDRSNVGEATFDLRAANTSRTIEADVTGMNATWILVTVTGGDATVDVGVIGIAADGTEMVLRAERLEITQAPRASSPSPFANDTAENRTNES